MREACKNVESSLVYAMCCAVGFGVSAIFVLVAGPRVQSRALGQRGGPIAREAREDLS